MRSNKWKRAIIVGACAFAGLVFRSSTVHASPIELLNWAPVPDSVAPPFAEIVYTGANLTAGPGATGNGDGNQPVPGQLPGGLQVDTILSAPVAFSFPDSAFTGGTGYYDVTLSFTGLAPVGNAIQAGGVDIQVLGAGTFTLFATAPAGFVPLLTGNIANAVITGADGGSAGALFDAHGITYTGGVIFGAFPGNFAPAGNDMSISMTGVIPEFGINGGTNQLNPFSADATGLFDVNTPEPTSLALVGLASMGLMARRRRRA